MNNYPYDLMPGITYQCCHNLFSWVNKTLNEIGFMAKIKSVGSVITFTVVEKQ